MANLNHDSDSDSDSGPRGAAQGPGPVLAPHGCGQCPRRPACQSDRVEAAVVVADAPSPIRFPCKDHRGSGVSRSLVLRLALGSRATGTEPGPVRLSSLVDELRAQLSN